VDRFERCASEAEFREALAHFATGITVVTASGPAGPHGVTVNAFASVSLAPPLVLVCIDRGHLSHAVLAKSGAFAVNVLAAGQEALSRFFAAPDRPEGPDAFRGIAFRPGRTGAPLLDGCVAYIECRVTASHPAGDHSIFVGAVEYAWAVPGRHPLLYYNRGYRRLDEA
jgi:flavin reductase (DIM6/NTAB) family NADH-FMN oxidoreductase RutF